MNGNADVGKAAASPVVRFFLAATGPYPVSLRKRCYGTSAGGFGAEASSSAFKWSQIFAHVAGGFLLRELSLRSRSFNHLPVSPQWPKPPSSLPLYPWRLSECSIALEARSPPRSGSIRERGTSLRLLRLNPLPSAPSRMSDPNLSSFLWSVADLLLC